jgi:hypothetical protein
MNIYTLGGNISLQPAGTGSKITFGIGIYYANYWFGGFAGMPAISIGFAFPLGN